MSGRIIAYVFKIGTDEERIMRPADITVMRAGDDEEEVRE